MNSTLKIALVLAMGGFIASAGVARADDSGNSQGQSSSSDNHGANQGGDGGQTSEAPLPLLGAAPFALAALGGGVFLNGRRRNAAKA